MLPFFAAVLPVVILFCGLVLDVGTMQFKRIQMQSAADAAALGLELELERGTGNQNAMALADASLNGFTNGVNGVTVTVNYPITGGPYSGDWDTVGVTVTQSVKTLFLWAFTGGTTTVSAQGVVLVPPCGYMLGGNVLNANPLWAASAGWYSGCPVYANRAVIIDGFGTMNALGENVAGGVGGSLLSGHLNDAPRFNATAMSDPLASIVSPTFSGTCNHTAYLANNLTIVLNPGTYCGGLTLTTATVTLNPGLYIITGGLNWSLSTVTGTGVTLFFTQGGGSSYGQFNIVSSTVHLSAPTDNSGGGIPMIVFFTDRNWVRTSNYDFHSFLSSYYGDGIWYGSAIGFNFANTSGNFTGPNYSCIVSDSLYFYLTTMRPLTNFSGIAGGNPFAPHAGLVQ